MSARLSATLALCMLPALGLLSGCRGRPPAPVAPVPTGAVDSMGPPSPVLPPDRVLTRDKVGRLRLGMSAEELQRQPDLAVQPMETRPGQQGPPALRVQQFGMPVALVELRDGRASRIRLVSGQYQTAEGARVGTTAEQLQALYGPGQLLTEAGVVAATFPTAPGLRFWLGTEQELEAPAASDWPKVLAKNPYVRSILIVGDE